MFLKYEAEGASVAEHILSMLKTLGSIPSTKNIKNKKMKIAMQEMESSLF